MYCNSQRQNTFLFMEKNKEHKNGSNHFIRALPNEYHDNDSNKYYYYSDSGNELNTINKEEHLSLLDKAIEITGLFDNLHDNKNNDKDNIENKCLDVLNIDKRDVYIRYVIQAMFSMGEHRS